MSPFLCEVDVAHALKWASKIPKVTIDVLLFKKEQLPDIVSIVAKYAGFIATNLTKISTKGSIMRVLQSHYLNGEWQSDLLQQPDFDLVLLFGDRELAQSSSINEQIKLAYPNAELVGCTTSGEIIDALVYDQSLVLTAIQLERAKVATESVSIDNYEDSYAAGKALASKLAPDGLKCVLVLSDGQKINGTELVAGLTSGLPEEVTISGGLAGDDARFEETLVWHNERFESGLITICGFYGDGLLVGHGSLGGWDAFGPDRIVTKANKNVLYEHDGRPALELYKSYLGEASKDLPSSALLFPLCIRENDQSESVVRTILNINEEDQSMTFAGDIPEGFIAKLMKANFERLVDGAQGAAENAINNIKADAELAILISCVGRRLVLKQRVDDELEVVSEMFSENTTKCGFYSYGEISPLVSGVGCHLHNQTMTITAISER